MFFSLLIALAVAGLFYAPAIGIHLANNWYSQQGEGYKLEAEGWQFSPFATRLSLTQVRLTHPKQATATTQLAEVHLAINPRLLLKKRLVIEELKLAGFTAYLSFNQHQEEAQIEIAGLVIPLAEEAAASAETKQATQQETPALAFNLEKLSLENFNLSWQLATGLATEELTSSGQLKLNRLQLANLVSDANTNLPVKLNLEITQFKLASGLSLEINQPLQLNLSGQLSQLFTQPSWQGKVKLSQINLALTGASLDENLALQAKELALEEVNFTGQQLKLGLTQLTAASLVAEQAEIKLATIALEKLSLSPEEQQLAKLSAQDVELTAEGNQLNLPQLEATSFSLTPETAQLETLVLTQLKLTSPANQLTISLPKLSAEQAQLELASQNFKLAAANLANLEVTQAANQIYLSQLKLKTARYQPAEQSLSWLRLENLEINQPSGQQTSQLNLTWLEAQQLVTNLNQQSFRLDKLHLGSSEDALSKLVFTDLTPKPQVKIQLKLHQLEINQLAGGLNQQGEFSLSPANFSLNLGVGDFGRLNSQGQLGLINLKGASYPEGQFKLQATQLDAVDFNGYLIKALGYQLDHGSLDATAHMQIKQAQLKGDINLLLRNSKFTPANQATIQRISKQISMPLETSLSLLRDKHGNLELQLPVSGQLNQPNFSWQPLINKITTKALSSASLYMLKQSLQPYSTFVSLGYLAGEYAFAIRLNALSFAEDSADLTPEHLAALQKLGELMQQKPKLEVTACPFVNPSEQETLADEWESLAYARGLAVKAWLEENFPKEAKRLTRCRPQQGKKAEVVLGVN